MSIHKYTKAHYKKTFFSIYSVCFFNVMYQMILQGGILELENSAYIVTQRYWWGGGVKNLHIGRQRHDVCSLIIFNLHSWHIFILLYHISQTKLFNLNNINDQTNIQSFIDLPDTHNNGYNYNDLNFSITILLQMRITVLIIKLWLY